MPSTLTGSRNAGRDDTQRLDCPLRVADHKVYERIDRLPSPSGLERNPTAPGGISDLRSGQCFAGGDGEVLGDLDAQHRLIAEGEPCEAGRMQLIGVAPERGHGLAGRITLRRVKSRTRIVDLHPYRASMRRHPLTATSLTCVSRFSTSQV